VPPTSEPPTATNVLLPVDVDYQRRHLAECCNIIVEDLSKLLAFVKYVDAASTNGTNHFENAECMRYLIQCTNSFCEKIEAALNGMNNEKFLLLVAEFNTDLEACIIRFAKSLA